MYLVTKAVLHLKCDLRNQAKCTGHVLSVGGGQRASPLLAPSLVVSLMAPSPPSFLSLEFVLRLQGQPLVRDILLLIYLFSHLFPCLFRFFDSFIHSFILSCGDHQPVCIRPVSATGCRAQGKGLQVPWASVPLPGERGWESTSPGGLRR